MLAQFLPDSAVAGEGASGCRQSADHIHITHREKAAIDLINPIGWMATPHNSSNVNLMLWKNLTKRLWYKENRKRYLG